MPKRIRRKNDTLPQPSETTSNEHSMDSLQPMPSARDRIISMQRQYGNQAVQRVLSSNALHNRIQRENDEDRVVNGVRMGKKDVADPNTYHGAATILKACGDALEGKIIAVYPGWGGKYAYAPTYFTAAALGKNLVYSDELLADMPSIDAGLSRQYLAGGLKLISPLFETINKVAPSDGPGWIDRIFWKYYRAAEVTIAKREADEAIQQASDKLAGTSLAGVTEQQAQVLQTTKKAYDTFDSVKKAIEAAEATHAYNKSLGVGEQFQQVVGKDLPTDPKLAQLDTPSAFSHVVSVLKIVDAIWKISDPAQRDKFARENYSSDFAQGTDIMKTSVEMLEASMLLMGGMLTVAIKLSPTYRHLAPEVLATFGKTAGKIGQVAGAIQIIYGVSVMLDSDADMAKKRGALMDIGLGTAAVTGSGPLAVATLVTMAEVEYIGSQVIGFQKGFQRGFSIGAAFRQLTSAANRGIAGPGRELAATMMAYDATPQVYGPLQNPEADVSSILYAKIPPLAARVKRNLGRFLKDCTDRTSYEYVRKQFVYHNMDHPAAYSEISSVYTPFLSKLDAAETPEQILSLAKDVMDATVTLLGDYDNIAKKQRIEANKDSIVLGGREQMQPTP